MVAPLLIFFRCVHTEFQIWSNKGISPDILLAWNQSDFKKSVIILQVYDDNENYPVFSVRPLLKDYLVMFFRSSFSHGKTSLKVSTPIVERILGR